MLDLEGFVTHWSELPVQSDVLAQVSAILHRSVTIMESTNDPKSINMRDLDLLVDHLHVVHASVLGGLIVDLQNSLHLLP